MSIKHVCAGLLIALLPVWVQAHPGHTAPGALHEMAHLLWLLGGAAICWLAVALLKRRSAVVAAPHQRVKQATKKTGEV